ncbi:hypothetical protein GS397_15080 [Sphingobium yanoikuyae]|uniref:Uncharacterized protein n=1 Tax=Sphingobium yanoikuyae TaxID=13690 RepID=A0A6P1GI80_SPHYA|nr:hypothetical protein [Sphingobium yanoikuyae]QHD68236.1 hypothetical protein GS397_15080 [Sphingobium yanoikuyae]
MGLGKITRGLGKVGLALEAIRYIVLGGAAVTDAVRGKPVEEKEDSAGEDGDSADQTVDRA